MNFFGTVGIGMLESSIDLMTLSYLPKVHCAEGNIGMLSTITSGISDFRLIKSQFNRSFDSTRASADFKSGSIPALMCLATNLSLDTFLGTEMNQLSTYELLLITQPSIDVNSRLIH